MKYLLILLLCISLTACEKSFEEKLADLGYTQYEIEKINTLDENTKNIFLESFNETYLKYLNNENCIVENLNKYVEFDNTFEVDQLIELINSNKLNKDNLTKLQELYSNEYYLAKYEDLYLYYIENGFNDRAYNEEDLTYFKEHNSVRDIIEIVNTKRYEPLYSDIQESDLSKEYLVLVNKYYKLPDDYEAADLVDVEATYGRGKLRTEVYEAYKQLYADAFALGYDLRCVSSYRSFYTQTVLYNRYLGEDTQENVDTYSARPGHSEHQSGLCLDVSIPGYSIDDFYKTDASVWLAENCYKYGFIIRYPEDKIYITGYQGEPWQIRYVGLDVAKDINEKQITFDEYYAVFVEQ